MTTLQVDNKSVQTDSNIQQNPSKALKILQTYITIISRYRLHLFNQYIQSNESCQDENLVRIRKEILHRFQLVINQLEQTIENLQEHKISENDVQEIINQQSVKEVIETSLNAELSTVNNRNQPLLNTDEWRRYRRDLQETKEDLHILNILLNRGILKIDHLVNVTNLYV